MPAPPDVRAASLRAPLGGCRYNLDSAYGSYTQLRRLLRTLQAQGVGAVLDCVINHRCGDTQNETGKWVVYSDELAHDNKRLDWGPWALVSNHPDPDLAGTGAAKPQARARKPLNPSPSLVSIPTREPPARQAADSEGDHARAYGQTAARRSPLRLRVVVSVHRCSIRFVQRTRATPIPQESI